MGKNCKIIILFVTIGVLYFIGVLLFYGHFGFRTYVNGKSVFLNTPEEVILDLQEDVNHKILTLVRRDGTTESVTYEQLGVLLKHQVSVDDLQCNPWLWFVDIFHCTEYTFDVSLELSTTVASKNIYKLECLSEDYVREPTNGFVSLLSDGTYNVVSDSNGNEIDIDKFVTVLIDAVLDGQDVIDLEQAGVYKYESIVNCDDDIVSDFSISELQDCQLTVLLGDGVQEVVPAAIITKALYNVDGLIYVHYPTMYAYVSYLARCYNTVGLERKFVTTCGDELTLYPSDNDTFYGWDLDVQATAKKLCTLLAVGQDADVKAVWITQGKSHSGVNDFGDTYVELNILQQHMWCYVDGELLFETDVTTGTDSIPSRRTPIGMFMTMDWNTEYTMRGSYGTAFSHYFIRLTPAGVGIHDASWRQKYGGTEYVYNGSHGCINTPYDKVKLLYDTLYRNCGVGLPVIIY